MNTQSATHGGDDSPDEFVRLTGHGVEQFATRRLVGRRVLPADAAFLAGLHRSQEVMAYHGGIRAESTTAAFVRSNVAHWRHYQFGLYMISLTDEPDDPIGRAGIRWDRRADSGPVVDVSVVLAPPAWGHGIATETARALTSIGLKLGLSLKAGAEARHAGARRVLEKTGYVYHSEYERHDRGWVRYQWPAGNPPPNRVEPGADR